MEELIKLVQSDMLRNPKPLISEDSRIIKSGVVKLNRDNSMVETFTPPPVRPLMPIKEFNKMLRINPPCKNGIIMVETENDFVLFCDLRNGRIKSKLEGNGALYSNLDKIVHYMTLNDLESVVFDMQGVFVKSVGSEEGKKDLNLEPYNKEQVKKGLISTAMRRSGNPYYSNNEQDIDIYITVQGIPVRFMKWRDLTGDIELSIKIETPLSQVSDKLSRIFNMKEGFLMINRELAHSIPYLIESEGGYKRVAFKGFGSLTFKDSRNICSYYGSKTTIEMIRSRGYDVLIVNLEKIDDYKELLALPTNKLCVLVYDFASVSKAVNVIKTLFDESVIIKNHIVSNLQAIVAGAKEEDLIVLDGWSRELLKHETDLNTIMTKISQPFIIRDLAKADLNKEIDIKGEISKVFEKANELGASNIDICPGSPVRLYSTKIKYIPYSTVKITPNLAEMMILNMLSPKEIDLFYKYGEIDTSYSLPGVGRYRVSITTQRSSPSLSIREIPHVIPTPEELNLPVDFVEDAVKNTKGITLIVGEQNCGKTHTFNCLIDKINRDVGGVLFLMGSPIEFLHSHRKSLVIQVEIGKDMESYTKGIAKSLRMNTSVLGFEELRTQAEFASLGAIINSPISVYMTMHAPSCRKASEMLVERLFETGISMKKAQEDVANALNYIIFQKLVDYKGKRVLIYERMKATDVIKNLIRNGNFNQIDNAIATENGCEPLDRVILRRLENGELDFDSVKDFVRDKRFFLNKGYNF